MHTVSFSFSFFPSIRLNFKLICWYQTIHGSQYVIAGNEPCQRHIYKPRLASSIKKGMGLLDAGFFKKTLP